MLKSEDKQHQALSNPYSLNALSPPCLVMAGERGGDASKDGRVPEAYT